MFNDLIHKLLGDFKANCNSTKYFSYLIILFFVLIMEFIFSFFLALKLNNYFINEELILKIFSFQIKFFYA